MELDKLREEIDRIDRELLSLFCRRMEVVAQVGQYKKERGLPDVYKRQGDSATAPARGGNRPPCAMARDKRRCPPPRGRCAPLFPPLGADCAAPSLLLW